MALKDKAEEFEGRENESATGRTQVPIDVELVDYIKNEFGASNNAEVGFVVDVAINESLDIIEDHEELEEAMEEELQNE